MHSKDLVSIIIPVFNRASMLREAVASVAVQRWRPLEVIIVDDGSTDDTPNAIRELALASNVRIRTLKIDNSGPGLAREAGRKIATGEFIQYLDSDDLLYPDKLELQVQALRQRPDADIAYGRTRYRIGGKLTDTFPGKRCHEQIDTLFPALLESRWWSTSTPLYRASVDTGWSGLRQEEDWEFEARVGKDNPKLVYVDQPVTEIRHHDGARSSSDQATVLLRLSERSKARQSIYSSAVQAGVGRSATEMQIFGRAAFLLGRQCAAVGLETEARTLLDLATRILLGRRRLETVIFRAAANLAGWQRAGRLAERMKP